MTGELRGIIKRQYNNFRIFRAYSPLTLAKELFLLPKDIFFGSGRSSNVLNIALFVTMRCNAKCAMCNITGVLNDRKMPDISLEKIERLLDEVKLYRPGIILFGGEPFVRNDIADMVRAVKKRGLTVGLFTNGTLISEKIASALIKERLDYLAFSLQGSKEVHDKVLAVPGAYEKMIRAIKLFTKDPRRHTKVVIHSTVCEYNVADLRAIVKLGEGLGVDLVRFGHPTFYSVEEEAHCTKSLRGLFKDSSDIKAMSYIYDIEGKQSFYLDNIKKLKDEFGRKICFTPELDEPELRSWYSVKFQSKRRCLFTWRGLFVYPNGDVYPCESIAYKMGNIFEEGFSAVWNGPKYREFRKALRKGLIPACARCCKL
jgi:radical SAM additional 4Fe4S-binding domain